MNAIFRVSQYLFRYKWMFVLTLLLAVGATAFQLSIPRLIQYAVDQVTEKVDSKIAIQAAVVMIMCYFARDLLNFLRIRVNNALEQKVLIELRKDLHRKLLMLPIAFFDQRKSGDIASRVIDDVNDVERALLDGTEQGITASLMIAGVTAMLFVMNSTLATLILIPLPIVAWIGYHHAKKIRLNQKKVRESAGELNSILVEDIQANRLIQSFGLQRRESERFHGIASELRKRTLRVMWRWSVYHPGTQFITSFGLVAVVGYGGYLLSIGSLTAGEFIAFFAYTGMVYDPISRLNQINHMIAAGKASGERVFEMLDHPLDIDDPSDPKPVNHEFDSIKYENVSFAYTDRPEVLENFDLEMKSGTVTALVGHTGAGKSTVANLLLRYYDVTSGSVKIGLNDVRELSLEGLRNQIAYVAQEPFLFDGSVRSNLALANEDATEEEMKEVLRSARAWDFVDRMPDGLDTIIGERGIRLSQGEKQRLTIARVLLRNPSIIILDEATASVDTETEKMIQDALNELMKGRTVLIIAHRLSTIRHADKIICLEHGKILEHGTHEELLEHAGHYAKLWNIQADLIPESKLTPKTRLTTQT